MGDNHPQVCVPGHLPTGLLDQVEKWVDLGGLEWRVDEMSEEFILWAIDFLLANASTVRAAWAVEHKATYDTNVKARRWMLDRPIMREFMGRVGRSDKGVKDEHRADYYELILREIAEMPLDGDYDYSPGLSERNVAVEALEGRYAASKPSSDDARREAADSALRRIAAGTTPDEVFSGRKTGQEWAREIAREALDG